uniref:Candidate secreted effector n=1 Tax=Meloidogyne incognita TaxID=6306 RepID=A0A914L212_MELIC
MRLLPTLLNLPLQQTKMNPALVHQQLQLPPLLVPLIQRQLLQMPQIGQPRFGE